MFDLVDLFCEIRLYCNPVLIIPKLLGATLKMLEMALILKYVLNRLFGGL